MSKLIGLFQYGEKAPFQIQLIHCNKEKFSAKRFVQRRLYSCVFVDCVFKNCIFDMVSFHECRFVRCKFVGCTFHDVSVTGKPDFHDCVGNKNIFYHTCIMLMDSLQAYKIYATKFTNLECIVSKCGRATMLQIGCLFYSLSYWKRNWQNVLNLHGEPANIGDKAAKELRDHLLSRIEEEA